jgi:hypothetical protein
VLVRRPKRLGPSRGLPQIPHVEERPPLVAWVPRVLLASAHGGQELPALCRFEQVEAIRRVVAADAVVQQAALLGDLQAHPTVISQPHQQADWPLHRLEAHRGGRGGG